MLDRIEELLIEVEEEGDLLPNLMILHAKDYSRVLAYFSRDERFFIEHQARVMLKGFLGIFKKSKNSYCAIAVLQKAREGYIHFYECEEDISFEDHEFGITCKTEIDISEIFGNPVNVVDDQWKTHKKEEPLPDAPPNVIKAI